MKEKRNADVREKAKSAKVALWQIADALGVHETALVRKLRYELSTEEKAKMVSIIEELRAEQEA